MRCTLRMARTMHWAAWNMVGAFSRVSIWPVSGFSTPSVSVERTDWLIEILPALTCLYMNRREAAALAGMGGDEPAEAIVGRLRALGLARGVITQGSGPIVGFDAFHVFSTAPPAPRTVADVTGEGDALAGPMTVALLNGAQYGEALREGMAAALLALESAAAVPELSRRAFAEALGLVPDTVEMR